MLHDALLLVLGAVLVSGGVMTAAAADRVRNLRISRTPRATVVPDAADLVPTEPASPRARGSRPGVSVAALHAEATGRADVVHALHGAGFKEKGLAERMTDACSQAERESIATWTRAALRRASRVEA